VHSLTIQQFSSISKYLFSKTYKYFFTRPIDTDILTPEQFLNKKNINKKILELVPNLPINTKRASTHLTETGLLAFGIVHELLVTAYLDFVPIKQKTNSSFDFLIEDIPFELKTINYSLTEIQSKYGLLLTDSKLKINNLHIFILNREGLFLLQPPFKYKQVNYKPRINNRDYVGIDVSNAIQVKNISTLQDIINIYVDKESSREKAKR
jgi:hypothetical protein